MSEESTTEVHSFDEALASRQVESGVWEWNPSDKWLQGRTIFGGLTVAAVAEAMTAEIASDTPEEAGSASVRLRTIQFTFLAPLLPGQATIRARVERRGRSATFASAEVEQDGAVVGRANAVYGAKRESGVSKVLAKSELEISLEESTKLPFIEGVTPGFTKNLDMHWAVDEFPFTEAAEGKVGGFVRFKAAASGVGAILGLLDAWPPSILTMLGAPAAASSVALTMHLVEEIPEFGQDDWFEFKYMTQSASEGYATEAGQLSFDGKAIAWVEQLVAVFDDRS